MPCKGLSSTLKKDEISKACKPGGPDYETFPKKHIFFPFSAGDKNKASHMLGKLSTTELHLQLWKLQFDIDLLKNQV
jgi:hypothetical protein